VKHLIFILILSYSCSKAVNQQSASADVSTLSIENAQTMVAFMSKHGLPDDRFETREGDVYLEYKNAGTYIFNESGKLKKILRYPLGDEKHLQFWLQKWKDQKVKVVIMNQLTHLGSRKVLGDEQGRVSIILNYNDSVDRVVNDVK